MINISVSPITLFTYCLSNVTSVFGLGSKYMCWYCQKQWSRNSNVREGASASVNGRGLRETKPRGRKVPFWDFFGLAEGTVLSKTSWEHRDRDLRRAITIQDVAPLFPVSPPAAEPTLRLVASETLVHPQDRGAGTFPGIHGALVVVSSSG